MLEAGLGRVVNNDAHQAVSAVSAYAISAKPIGVLGAVGSAASCTSSCTSPLQKNRLSFAAHVLSPGLLAGAISFVFRVSLFRF